MAILAFLILLSAMLMALLGRHRQPLSAFAVLIAWGSLVGVRRGDPSMGLLVAAYVAFGIALAAGFSGVSRNLHNRALVGVWLGTMLSLGLLALAMWADVRSLVVSALGLVVVMYVAMVIVIVKWNGQGNGGASTVG